MGYILLPKNDHLVIVNDNSDSHVGYVHARDGTFYVEDVDRGLAAEVSSLDAKPFQL
jgi:hypothetical protein